MVIDSKDLIGYRKGLVTKEAGKIVNQTEATMLKRTYTAYYSERVVIK